jgi:hypothetical protein
LSFSSQNLIARPLTYPSQEQRGVATILLRH